MARKLNNSKTKDKVGSPAIRREAKLWGVTVAGILLLIAVFMPDRVGIIGFVHGLLLGLFGLGGFVLPIALICFGILGLISKQIRLPVVLGPITAWLILAWLHFIFARIVGGYTGLRGIEYLRYVYSSGRVLGGGVVGAILGNLFYIVFGTILSVIIISVLIIILLMFITGRSFMSLISRGYDKARIMYEERAASKNNDVHEKRAELKPLPGPKKSPAELKPLERRGADITPITSQRADLIDINIADRATDDVYTVKLIQEELDAARAVQSNASGPVKAVTVAPVAATPTAVAPNSTERKEIDPVDADNDDAPPLVRGLVDGADTSLASLFDDDSDDMAQYDEYAHVGRTAGTAHIDDISLEPSYENFVLPSLDLLAQNTKVGAGAESRTKVLENSHILEDTLRSFRVDAKVIEVSVGPTVTRYDLAPGPGVKVSAIANLSNDLALSLAAQGIRIEAPIPGKAAVGIEIPNKEPQGVFLREIIECERFENYGSKLAFAVGKDIAGNPVVADVADMPHLLIAGATGAGKSVCINTLIASLLYKARPDEVKLLMIDPKVVELSVYNGIPHLLIPVVTDPKKASGALNWAVQEMESRYNAFAETGCRDLKSYNNYLENEQDDSKRSLPQIVIIIDELADLMMTAKGEVEEAICRLAQKARAAGIHLIVATQRPSVDVITGLIKANIPSRLAFAVSSGTDSRTVLDMHGAEKLLGRGDMLFLPRGQSKPVRIQGGFISDKEVEQLVAFLKAQAPMEHTTEMIQQITMPGKGKVEGEVDEFFHDAVDFLLTKGKASTSMLQRQFRIGYNRASRLMDDLEVRGIVGPEDGVKPRKVTITREEYREIYDK